MTPKIAFRNLWPLALFFAFFGAQTVYPLVDKLASRLAGLIATDEAATSYDLFMDEGPTAELVWDICMFSTALLLVFLLRWLGVLRQAFPLERLSTAIIILIPVIVVVDLILSETLLSLYEDWFVSGELDIYEDGYAFAWTPEYLPTDIIGACMAAPVYEELVFRGLLLGVLLTRGWHPAVAIGLSSLIFAYTHVQYNLVGMFVVFISGCLLGMLRWFSGGLVAPMIAHGLLNAISVLLDVANYFSGGEETA